MNAEELRKQFAKEHDLLNDYFDPECSTDELLYEYCKQLESLVLASDQRERETAWKAWEINARHTYNHAADFDIVLEVELFNNWFNEQIKP